MLDKISGGVRLSSPLGVADKGNVSKLLDQIRSDPRFAQDRSKFEFRVVQNGGGQYLELKQQNGFGRFKEAIGWGAERRQQEREAGLRALSDATGKDVSGMVGPGDARTTSRAAAAMFMDQDIAASLFADQPGSAEAFGDEAMARQLQQEWGSKDQGPPRIERLTRGDQPSSLLDSKQMSGNAQAFPLFADRPAPAETAGDEAMARRLQEQEWDSGGTGAPQSGAGGRSGLLDSGQMRKNVQAFQHERAAQRIQEDFDARGGRDASQPVGPDMSRAGPSSAGAWSGAARTAATGGMRAVSADAFARGAGNAAIPSNATVSDVTQLHGTNTCWALSMLMACLEAPDLREHLDKRFTLVGDTYQFTLKSADVERVRNDHASDKTLTGEQKDAIKKFADDNQGRDEIIISFPRSKLKPNPNDRRAEWVRAFEAMSLDFGEKNLLGSDYLHSNQTGRPEQMANLLGFDCHGAEPPDDLYQYLGNLIDTGSAVIINRHGHNVMMQGVAGKEVKINDPLRSADTYNQSELSRIFNNMKGQVFVISLP